MSESAQLRLMVAVKAYPSISTKYDELVCCAGVTDDRKWVRLYPVSYRDLPNQKQFQKGDIIEVTVERRAAHKDDRPESWRPRLDTMHIVGKVGVQDNWRHRLEWIEPTMSAGFGEILDKQQSENKSLGAFRPTQILGVRVKKESAAWTDAQLATINQKDLFSEKEPLEKVPFRFQLGFKDERGAEHWLSIIDWEFFQLWRKQRDQFRDEAKAADQVKKKIEWIVSGDKDVIAFVGNLGNPAMRRHVSRYWRESDFGAGIHSFRRCITLRTNRMRSGPTSSLDNCYSRGDIRPVRPDGLPHAGSACRCIHGSFSIRYRPRINGVY